MSRPGIECWTASQRASCAFEHLAQADVVFAVGVFVERRLAKSASTSSTPGLQRRETLGEIESHRRFPFAAARAQDRERLDRPPVRKRSVTQRWRNASIVIAWAHGIALVLRSSTRESARRRAARGYRRNRSRQPLRSISREHRRPPSPSSTPTTMAIGRFVEGSDVSSQRPHSPAER